VDLEHGVVHVHQALDRFRGQVKATKGKRARRVPIEPTLLPLLEAMWDESAGEGRVVDMPPDDEQSSRLREYLRRAGVGREELYANDETRKNITFHDLRATGITWLAIGGLDPLKIKASAGHRTL
jgi:integrase